MIECCKEIMLHNTSFLFVCKLIWIYNFPFSGRPVLLTTPFNILGTYIPMVYDHLCLSIHPTHADMLVGEAKCYQIFSPLDYEGICCWHFAVLAFVKIIIYIAILGVKFLSLIIFHRNICIVISQWLFYSKKNIKTRVEILCGNLI